MKKEEYLSTLTEQIRCKMARDPVRAEIQGHIEDQMEVFLEEGMSREEAEDAAVAQMGDPVEAGGALDRIHRPRMAWGMILLISILGVAGILLQDVLQRQFAGEYSVVIDPGKLFVFLILSFCIMILVCFADYSRIGACAKAITAGMFLVIMAGMAFFGGPINGTRYWIASPLGYSFFVSVQMFTLLLVPLYGAILYTYRQQGYRAVLKSLFWMLPGFLIAGMIPSTLIFTILFFSYVIVLSAALWKGWFRVARKAVLPILWGVTAALPFLICRAVMNYAKGYRAERLKIMFLPDYAASFQLRAVQRILESSRWLGMGAGKSEIGEVSSYTLTYTIYYYGILAGVLLAGLILFLFLRFFRISLRQKNQLGMIMGVGCSAVLMVQLGLYLACNLGIVNMPTYCPFLNYGGSGMVVSFTLYGLMLSIYRYENVLTETWAKKWKAPHWRLVTKDTEAR
ncbi:MAG: permease prefix domain 1-containing protein [Lachnospiraceae bacterium]|nr:permease prefix domain 1-containing protein [Lachnospiraceae bacterium]